MGAIDWSAVELPCLVEHLANGLTVVVHVEPKSPIAAVCMGYKAGSRDDPPFKAGLAHLCEHLMFCGTKTNPGSYFAPFEQAGATSINAFVREDYSAYFETVPIGVLDYALSMEADRLGNIAESLDDERVQRQREVCINELHQREAQPYGCIPRLIAELAHPAGHPYAHLPDGLISELGNISTDDVRLWVLSRHHPSSATLIVAGDVEPGRVIAEAERHFGGIANRGAAPAPDSCSSIAQAESRLVELPVKQNRVCIAWTGPSFASAEFSAVELACEILAGGKSSRLWNRIVRTLRFATDLALEMRPREFGTLIVLSITATSGVDLSAIEAAARAEITRLFEQGPTLQELDNARLRLLSTRARSFEHVGGSSGKAATLALATIVAGTPDSHRDRLSALARLEPEDVAAARWLTATGAVLELLATDRGNAH